MVNETTVKTFLTLVRVRSITGAAAELYLTQQAVSKQLAKLEQDLDCTLLRRDRGRLKLTAAGEVYYEAFSKIDDIYTAARLSAARLSNSWENSLFLAQPELLDIYDYSYPYLQTFQKENPQVEVTFHSAPLWNMLKWLEDGTADAVYIWESELEGRPDIESVPLGMLQEMLVVSTAHPKAAPDAGYLDFRDETVFFTEVPEGREQPFDQRMHSIGFPTDKLKMTDNMLSSCAAVDQLQGVNFLMENCQILQNPRYRTYPTPNRHPFVLAYRTDNQKRSLRRMIEAAREWSKNKN